MWFKFGNIEERTFESKDGKEYQAFELTGIKQGWQNNPDTEWSRKIFRNQATTVIENGVERPGISIVSFFQNAVEPGALIDVKQVKNGNFYDIVSVQDITNGASGPAEYTPMTTENAPSEESSGDLQAPEMPTNPWD